MIVCRLVENALLSADTVSPLSRRRSTSARSSVVRLAGRPMALPSARARRSPAWVRSISRSRSNSATALITPIVSLPVDEVRSTPPSARQWTDGFGNTSGTFDGERVYLRRDRFGDTHGMIGGAFVALHRDEFGNIRGMIGGEYVQLHKDRFGNTYGTVGGRSIRCHTDWLGYTDCG